MVRKRDFRCGLVSFTLLVSAATARSDDMPVTVLRDITAFFVQTAHCRIPFAGDMLRELKVQHERLQRVAGLDDAAVQQLSTEIDDGVRGSADCNVAQISAIPTAMSLIHRAHRIR